MPKFSQYQNSRGIFGTPNDFASLNVSQKNDL
jgi:hypothetical protein